ncbi:hypothetical protein Fcan01_17366 [Folsomia candida]|uniref:Uncharacterized protein n=1 Tax=Folsomia candida TaxID=158441 RepID=A0A226DU70_FOLCA|nr:hypothetical protein Fcan01_17366 [Folsomia candida]
MESDSDDDNNSNSSFTSSISNPPSETAEPPPNKIPNLDIYHPIKEKLFSYLDQFTVAVRSGEFAVQIKLKTSFREDVPPPIGLRVTKILNNKDWSTFEKLLKNEIETQFGLAKTGNLSISLKKLIIQKAGSKFPTDLNNLLVTSPKRNDEELLPLKSKTSFAHLVIQLPSHYTGGHIRFRHEGKLKEFDLSASMTASEGWTSHSLAYYPHLDQIHGIISSGVRSCLIYNLEIELANPKTEVPVAPTLKNIVPSFSEIVQESKTMGLKVLPLVILKKSYNNNAICKFLGDTLRYNGVTLFEGVQTQGGVSRRNSDFYVNWTKLLLSVNVHEEEGFLNFFRNEEPEVPHCEENIYQNEDWIKSQSFWRFQSYLFLTKYKQNVEKNTPKSITFLRDAYSLVSLETIAEGYKDLFPKVSHFQNLVNKFALLEDTEPLKKLFQICQKRAADFTAVFPSLLKFGVGWNALQSVLQDYFALDGIKTGEKFLDKAKQFRLFVAAETLDKSIIQFKFETFEAFTKKFKELYAAQKFTTYNHETLTVLEFFLIAEVLRYNMLEFAKSIPPTFLKRVLCSKKLVKEKFGVMWVRLVTDIYCCTNLMDDCQLDEEELECRVLASYFQLVEKFGVDITGILGNVKKYGVLVKALARHTFEYEGKPGHDELDESDEEDEDEDEYDEDYDVDKGSLPKFWVPFVTKLEARIEAVMAAEIGNQGGQGNTFDLAEGTEMLEELRKLLATVNEKK